MKKLRLEYDYKAVTDKLKKECASKEHAEHFIDDDMVVIGFDGSTIAVYLKQVIPLTLVKRAYRRWRKIDDFPEHRTTALGSISQPRIRKDQTLGRHNVVWKNTMEVWKKRGTRHGILGYAPSGRGKPYRRTPLTVKNPKMLTRNKPLIKLVNKLFKRYLPSVYRVQKAEIDRVPEHRLWHTAFSTVYLAKKFQTRYHRDRGNLKCGMTALTTMGDFMGGMLIIPRWRLAFVLRPGDLLFFNPDDLHGNTEMQGKRLSVAFYCGGRIGHGTE